MWCFIDPLREILYAWGQSSEVRISYTAVAGRDSASLSRMREQRGCFPLLEFWTLIYELKGFFTSHLPPGFPKQMFYFMAQLSKSVTIQLNLTFEMRYATWQAAKVFDEPPEKSDSGHWDSCRHIAQWGTTEGEEYPWSCSDLLAAVVTEVVMIRRVKPNPFKAPVSSEKITQLSAV